MPIHDWTRLEPGDFHDLHPCWATFPALLKELIDPTSG
jgi:hypothetical protein